MPKAAKGNSGVVLLISILGGALLLLSCCCAGGVAGWYVFFQSGTILSVAKLDPDNVQNTRAWAEKTVARLKEIEAKGDQAATDREVVKLEKEMQAALVGKKTRWALVVYGVKNGNEADLEQFFGNDDGFEGGRKRRKLYFRIYYAEDGDEVLVGEFNPQQAKGSRFTLQRTIIEANIRKRDTNWKMPNSNNGVDVLDTFCVDIIVKRQQ
jgi:hypothetical protein